jgi:threonine dehydrogenase-like Zn-dependent dehydrogenase
VTNLAVGDQVVIPFQISCGSCYMCDQQLFTQCETTQAATTEWVLHCSATPNSTARFPAVKPSCSAHRKPSSPTSRSREGPPDTRFVYLCDVLPTAWQAVAYADIPAGGSVAVLGLRPIGDMAARIAVHLSDQVIAVDRVPEPLARAQARGVQTIDLNQHGGDLTGVIRDMTAGRGTDSVIDAVGTEAHGSPIAEIAQQVTGMLPDAAAKPMMQKGRN